MNETTGNRMNSRHATNKPFHIDKRLVYEAFKVVTLSCTGNLV